MADDVLSTTSELLGVGERKVATVLFVDIVDSSSLVAAADPELAEDRMMPVLSLSCDVIVRLGGSIAQILGDGVLAIFGAPRSLEDHARRACIAATEILCMARGLPGQIELRAGISSGELVIRQGVAEELRCIGEAVHMAARAQQSAAPGAVVITGATRELLEQDIAVWAKGTVQLGKEPVPLFDLVSTSNSVGGSRVARHEVSPLIGRGQELATLTEAATSAINGHGSIVLIRGEAGVGKTRLASALLARLDNTSVNGFRIELEPKVLQTPFRALVQLLNHCFAPAGTWTSLEAMPGFPNQDDLDSSARLRKIARWACQVVSTAARKVPMVLVFEDVDRLDSVTAMTLRCLIPEARASELLIMMTLRTNTVEPESIPHSRLLDLYPLTLDASRRLARFLLTGDAPPSKWAEEALCAKGQGNPYFLEECARTRGSLSNATMLGPYQPPASIHTLLSERIDGLPTAERRILLLMSVVGETSDVAVLKRVSGLTSENLLKSLVTLTVAGFIYQLRILPSVEFSFHHSLVRDVAYRTLLLRVRQDLHGSVLESLLALAPRKHDANPRLAHHAFYARRWREGYVYAVRAARDAKRISRNEEALALLMLAEQCLNALSGETKIERRRIDLLRSLASVSFVMGRHLETRAKLADALKAARRLGDKPRSVAVLSDIGLSQWGNGQLKRACASMGLVRRIAQRESMREPWIRASARLGMLLANCGEFRKAITVLHEAANEIPDSQEFSSFGLLGSAASGVRAALSAAYSEVGDFDAAARCGGESLDIAFRSGHPFSKIYANTYVANGLLLQGDHGRAMPLLEDALHLCESTGSDVLYPQAAAMLVNTWARSGRGRATIKELFDRVVRLDAEDLRARRPVGAHWMAEAFALVGDTTRAIELVEAALVVSRAGAELSDTARALRLRGNIALRQEDWSYALDLLSEGAELARRCGMEPLVKACRQDMVRARSVLEYGHMVVNGPNHQTNR